MQRMLGKALVALLVMVPLGILIGLIRNPFTEAIAALLFMVGSAALGLLAILALLLLVEGFLFRSADRWHRFN